MEIEWKAGTRMEGGNIMELEWKAGIQWNYDGTRMEGSTTMELQWNGMALMGHRIQEHCF